MVLTRRLSLQKSTFGADRTLWDFESVVACRNFVFDVEVFAVVPLGVSCSL